MNKNDILFSVGFDHKYGGFDFGVRGDTANLSSEQFKDLCEMIVFGIGKMIDMRRAEKDKHNPPASAEPRSLKAETNHPEG